MEQNKFMLIDRKTAILEKSKHYFTGKLCKNGHIDRRLVSSLGCCTCSVEKQQTHSIKQYKAKHYLLNKEKIAQKAKLYYETNKKSILKKSKIYQQTNLKKILIYQQFYKKQKSQNNPAYKLSLSIKASISAAMRRVGSSKGRVPTLKFIECSLEELKLHIEKQFLRGMNWENRNLWHIDHIVPLASGKTYEEIGKLNHFTNLRPLWSIDNLKKSSKIEFLI